jgi:hypothetical protein
MENFGVRQKVSDLDPKNTVYIFQDEKKGALRNVANSFPYLEKLLEKPDPESMIPKVLGKFRIRQKSRIRTHKHC